MILSFRQQGFSLVELMIALTIGLIISLALATMFSQVSVTNREQFKAAVQIENGRYAMDLVSNDLRLAGFYGDFSGVPMALAALPDPCVAPAAGSITTATTTSDLAFPVQGYPASSLTASATVPTACQDWIDSNTLKPGTDILVVRRLDTIPLLQDGVANVTAVNGTAYAQTSSSTLDVQYGTDASIDNTKTAANAATVLTRKDFTQALGGSPATRPQVAAYIRQLHVHVYFVANCRVGSGGTNKTCTSSDDTIPTLKRLELSTDGTAPVMKMVPLAEGIEFFKVFYGVDTTGDGQVDSSGWSQPDTVANWQNVVQAEIRLVARNTEASSGYVDTNRYSLGGALTYTPSGNDAKYRRHAFDQQVYITNVGGRREK